MLLARHMGLVDLPALKLSFPAWRRLFNSTWVVVLALILIISLTIGAEVWWTLHQMPGSMMGHFCFLLPTH